VPALEFRRILMVVGFAILLLLQRGTYAAREILEARLLPTPGPKSTGQSDRICVEGL